MKQKGHYPSSQPVFRGEWEKKQPPLKRTAVSSGESRSHSGKEGSFLRRDWRFRGFWGWQTQLQRIHWKVLSGKEGTGDWILLRDIKKFMGHKSGWKKTTLKSWHSGGDWPKWDVHIEWWDAFWWPFRRKWLSSSNSILRQGGWGRDVPLNISVTHEPKRGSSSGRNH